MCPIVIQDNLIITSIIKTQYYVIYVKVCYIWLKNKKTCDIIDKAEFNTLILLCSKTQEFCYSYYEGNG